MAAQDYDKILKENIEEIILPLAEKLLKIKADRMEEIPDDLQRTIERRPDFLKKILHDNSDKDFILHIEFQTDDDPNMVYRMVEYYSLLLRRYKIDVYQYVFFIGEKKAKMPTSLSFQNLIFGFDLLNFQDISYRTFLNSDTPEEVILAILADFDRQAPEDVIAELLKHLKTTTQETLRLEKCVKQLEILSNLRNLQSEIINQLETMALKYDLEKDLRYKQGEQVGEEKKTKKMIIALLEQKQLSFQQIAEVADVPLSYIEKIAAELKELGNLT
jgi:predicted HTH domain antitoxin